VADEHEVDGHLVAVLNEVLDAVYQAKQADWAASTSPHRATLDELLAFLIDQSGRLMIAEERIEGRSPDVSPPSTHQRGNLVADAHGDVELAISLLTERLDGVINDARARAALIADSPEASTLLELADGLEARVRRLTT